MASRFQHPAWLLVGLACWMGCELVSGVGDLKVGAGSGGSATNAGSGGSGGTVISTRSIGGSGPGTGSGQVGAGGSGGHGGTASASVNAAQSSGSCGNLVCGDGHCDKPCETTINCTDDCFHSTGLASGGGS